ncbi:MAG: hypothetical protein FWH44_05215, partial [Methanomassiliicoccaceae archaeon]|nr:hypothetical protein [Methanomassiliicoccaceae archaeon]
MTTVSGGKNVRPKQWLFALAAAAVMLTMVVMPAVNVSAAERLTVYDGIDPDEESGLHNAYAWCGALFEQDDGSYLWTGTNRDIGANILGRIPGIAGIPEIYDLMGIPAPSADAAGEIYRYNLNAAEPVWELMYKDPAINGYRKMLVFNDDLYVFAGLSNRSADPEKDYNYTAVYRFPADFKAGDTPDVVLWERLPPNILVQEYFRAACIYDGKLYVGTYDCRVWCTDGTGLMAQTPTTGAAVPDPARYAGWTPVAVRTDMAG